MPKKAQITLFIILGIVIVTAALIVIYVKSNLIKTTEGEAQDIIKSPYKSANVKLFVESCLGIAASKGLTLLGIRGGFVEFPADVNTMVTSRTIIPFLYYRGEIKLPTLAKMAEELSKYIGHEMIVCLDNFNEFKKMGYNIETGDISTTTNISDFSVVIKVDYPIIIKDEKGTTEISEFYKQVPLKLGKIYKLAEDIMAESERYDSYAVIIPELDFDTDLPYDYYPIAKDTFLWIIQDDGSQREVYSFMFGTKYKRLLP